MLPSPETIDPQGKQIADVLMPFAVDTAYSYAVPAHLTLAEGDVVVVPLGSRQTTGVVWSLQHGNGSNLKSVLEKTGAPAFDATLRSFLDWIARYTVNPRGSVLGLALRTQPETPKPEPVRVAVRATGALPARATPARTKVLAVVGTDLVHLKKDLAKAAGVSATVIDGLVDDGALEAVLLPPDPPPALPDPEYCSFTLSEEQITAANMLRTSVRAGQFAATLLEGITGSGKTEVYFEAVAEAIRLGRQALILMPEIALTAGFLERFKTRFGVYPHLWHSGVTGRERQRTYTGIADGRVRVIAGARSALFLPFSSLGLIVVDEEHEAAYKQEDGICYHARDMAVMRAHGGGFPVVLASATPAIETQVNAQRGRYQYARLQARHQGRQLPTLEAIDLRKHTLERNRWLSPPLIEAVQETVSRGEQALLFLNRRGYAPLTVCRACGHRFHCTSCSAWLVEHRFRKSLNCHHCGHVERRPDACPACGTLDALTAAGPGVERLCEEVTTLFTDKRITVLSSDTPGGANRMRAELEAVERGEADIVIGTQLVAKGHHFPSLTLVGVVDADLSLMSADPRAAERTFQILQQVTGRAGRGDKAGRALLQTRQPDHPVMEAILSGDMERFYETEIAIRATAGLPPFGRLAALIVSGSDRMQAENHARALAQAAHGSSSLFSKNRDITVLGPAEAPLALLRGRYRFRLLVKAPRESDVSGYVRAWLAQAPKPRGNVRVNVDVDPQSFL